MKMKFKIEDDRYFVYCPKISNKAVKTLESQYWNKNENFLPGELHEIFQSSPKVAKSALEQHARNFKREQRYDGVQYCSLDYHDPKSIGAFIWIEECMNNDFVDQRVIGGACFRYRDNYSEECKEWNGWAMQWVYVHPNFRRNGLLNDSWDYFKARYGDFVVEEPLSTEMNFFLAKKGLPKQAQKIFLENSGGPKSKLWGLASEFAQTEYSSQGED